MRFLFTDLQSTYDILRYQGFKLIQGGCRVQMLPPLPPKDFSPLPKHMTPSVIYQSLYHTVPSKFCPLKDIRLEL